MFPTGTVIHNPVTGEWARVLVAAEDTGGAYVQAELLAQPTGHPAGPHRHPRQEERFEVLEGRLTYQLGEQQGVIGPGEGVVIAPGVAHDWWNATDSACRARVTVSPPGRFDEMIAAVWGIAVLGRTNGYGAPGLLDGVLLAEAFGQEIEFLSPPPLVQKAMARVAAPLVRRAGRTVDDPEVLHAAVVDPAGWPRGGDVGAA